MKGKSAWLAGVAAVALVASTQAGYAAKGTSDNMSGSTPAPMAAGPSNAELESRIDALEAELQQSEMRQAADHDKVDSWKPMSGWWDNTKISGRMYWDITNIDNSHTYSGAKHTDTNNGTAFDIKRFYIGIDHTFDKVFSANVTTDVTYDSGSGASQLFIKKAYLQAKLDPAFTVRIGATDLPWIPYAEGVYGYRFVENTLSDRTKFGTSSDWGIHVLGDLADGIVSYDLAVVNGAGYKKAAVFRTNSPDVEGRVSLNYQGLQLAVGGYEGKLGVQHGTSRKTATRLNALAAYSIDGLKVGVEYFTASNWNFAPGVSSATGSSHGYGYSPFGSYQFTPEWAVFGRYDYVKPYSDLAHKPFHNDYFNVGVNWRPTKIVDFALVYKRDAGNNGAFGDSNGTIGGSTGQPFAAGNKGTYSEVGIWGDFQW